MKIKWLAGLALVGALLTSCSKENDGYGETQSDIQRLDRNPFSGLYSIERAMVSGNNMTDNYAGMEFHFSKDGAVTVRTKTQTHQGKFFVTDDGLVLEMPATADLAVLTGKWIYESNLNSFTLFDEKINPSKTITFMRILKEAPDRDGKLTSVGDEL